MIYIIIFLFTWTVISVWWFIKNIGNKYHKDTIIDYILCPPALCLCFFLGIINKFLLEPIQNIIDQWRNIK